jgi:hypothetical protein
VKIKLIDFISNFTDDKTLIRIQCDSTGTILYEGRAENLKNDYSDEYGADYKIAYDSMLSWLDNSPDNLLLIYVKTMETIEQQNNRISGLKR